MRTVGCRLGSSYHRRWREHGGEVCLGRAHIARRLGGRMGGAEEDETAEEDRQDDEAAERRRLASGTALGASVTQAVADDQRSLSMAASGGEHA